MLVCCNFITSLIYTNKCIILTMTDFYCLFLKICIEDIDKNCAVVCYFVY